MMQMLGLRGARLKSEDTAMSSQDMGAGDSARALRLVFSDERGKFKMDPDSVAALQLGKGPLGVVSVCGRARQGKSFILNPEARDFSAIENRGVSERSNKATRMFKYHQENGEEVVCTVTRGENSYKVSVVIYTEEDNLYMHWNIFRSRSSDWGRAVLQDFPAGTKRFDEAYQSMFQKVDTCVWSVQFELRSNYAPFFIEFKLFQGTDKNFKGAFLREASTEQSFVLPIGCGRGHPDPLGSTIKSDGSINFSLYSKRASAVILCLYCAWSTQPPVEIELLSSVNRTGNTWHIELDDSMYERYGYRCMGESSWDKGNRFHARRILLDPYAKILAPFLPGQENLPCPAIVLGSLPRNNVQFDWGDDVHPDIPLEELVVYRLNVTGFTADKSSALRGDALGTFEGLADKAQHFKSLGVNCIILQPIFFFEKKKNSYYPLSFFAPMDCFGPEKTSASSSHSLKKAIKELHKNGIEVLLDVVVSHTGENNDEIPKTVSFRGIDNATYYILDETGRVTGSDMGAENRFSCNHPVVHTMILDSLRHWVVEYHVDGFCFQNASALTKGPHGEELSRPLLVEAISFDQVLSKCKLFADISSPFTGVTKDMKFPHWKRWCLWNNRYREDVRQFMRGDKGQLSSFATRLCGSGDMLADGRGPNFSLNHVIGPYGLTLVDLVSYSASIEADLERSWNCGEEGRTLKQAVLNIRVKQVRNYLMCLFLSQGIPILNMGDECGLSKGGSLSVDQRLYFNWDALKLDFGKQTSHFIAALAAFRSRRKDLFQRKDFVKLENIQWHGAQINEPDWESLESSFIAVSLISEEVSGIPALGDVYIGFNSGNVSVIASLPEPPSGMDWHLIADTSLPFPQCFQEHGSFLNFPKEETRTYEIQPYSSILLEARSLAERYSK